MPENNPIPDAELAELKRLHAAATPGEWQAQTYSNYAGWSVWAPDGAGCIAERWYSTGTQDEIPRNDLWIVAAKNAFPALLARLEAAERERDELEAELEEARDDSAEYEKDCKKALCSLAREFNYEWDGDGATADELREFISGTMRNALEHAVAMQNDRDGAVYAMIVNDCQIDAKALAARDSQQRREGAAEWLENAAREGGYYERSSEGMLEEAKQLREGK